MDKGHGRIEKRQYYLETDIEWLEEKNKWTGLKGIGAVKSTVTRNGNTTAENFAIVRHIALSALKNYELKGVSLARKRRMCQYDCEFMANVLLSIR